MSGSSYASHRAEVGRAVRRFERARAALVGEICTSAPVPELLTGVLAFTPFVWAPPLLEFVFFDKALAGWSQRCASHLASLNLRKPMDAGDGVRVVMSENTLRHGAVRFRKGRWAPRDNSASSHNLIRGAIAAAGTVTPTGLLIAATPAAPITELYSALDRFDIPHTCKAAAKCEIVEIPAERVAGALARLGLTGSVGALTTVWKQTSSAPAAPEVGETLTRGACARRLASVKMADEPVLEATRIAALGSLTRYTQSAGLRDTARQLVTDEALSYDQCAASLNIPTPMFRRRLSRFWSAVEDNPGKTRSGINLAGRTSA